MELIQLIQTVGPFVAIVMFFIYNEVRNRSKETEADSEIKKALAALTTQQQTQSERDSQRIQELSIRIDEQNRENINLRERVAAYEGAQRILEGTMKDDRDRWEKKEAASEKQRSELRAKLGLLELQLDQQQATINKLEKHLNDKEQEITALRETNETLQTERDSLVTQNTSLENAVQAMTERLELQDTESHRHLTEREALQKIVFDIQRKLAECEAQEQVEKKITDRPKPGKEDNPLEEKQSA